MLEHSSEQVGVPVRHTSLIFIIIIIIIIIILFKLDNKAHKHEQETYRQTDRQCKWKKKNKIQDVQ